MVGVETDFWKDEQRRAAWDEIEVGVERQTRPVELTLEIIQAYARAIGDLNPCTSTRSTRSRPFSEG